MMGIDPILLGVLIGLVLQTSFLTPPFGFALFYLRGVAPPSITTGMIYRGVVAFVAIQILVLALVWTWPKMATWLPYLLFRQASVAAQSGEAPPLPFDANTPEGEN